MSSRGEDRVYPLGDERPHAIGTDPMWQESVVIFWWDDALGLGGYQRLGHEPNADDGVAVLISAVFTADGQRLRSNGVVRLGPSDHTADTFKYGDTHSLTHDDRVHWSIRGDELEVALDVEDFFPHMDLWPRTSGTLSSQIAAGHTECGGRVRGHALIRGRRHAIDGLCFRDHSWGKRDWSQLGKHNWVSGSCGRGLSFSAINFQATNGEKVSESLVVRDGWVDNCRDFSIVATSDFETGRITAGKVDIRLSPSDVVSGEFTPVDGVASLHRGYLMYDYICRLRVGDQTGFFVYEIAKRHDGLPIPTGSRLARDNGWTTRPADLLIK